MGEPGPPPHTIWTIGHSTRTTDELLALLHQHRIELLADVRRYPGSRRWPRFNQEALATSLAEGGIAYLGIPLLGGRRRPRPDSPNTAWRHPMFRGYADYMATEPFAEGLRQLLERARRQRTCLMCSEAVWWRCHRGLIADALRIRGIEVLHILSATSTVAHPWTSAARVVAGRLTYSADPPP